MVPTWKNEGDTMKQENQRTTRPRRRRYSAEFRAHVVGECNAPGASVAATALAHGINANVVHRWRRQEREQSQTNAAGTEFIPVALPPVANGGAAEHPRESIEIRLRRGATQVHVRWPAEAARDCAAWLTELMRGPRWSASGWPRGRWTCARALTRSGRAWWQSSARRTRTPPTALPTAVGRG